MKKAIILLAALLTTSISVNAATVTTGTLTYDNVAGTITDSVSGTYYLGWNLTKELTYAETLSITQAGALYGEYHIASQTEAEAFYASSDPENTGPWVNGQFFGDSSQASYDVVWFLSDGIYAAGRMLYSVFGNQFLPSYTTIAQTDQFSLSGGLTNVSVGWLLVQHDSNLIATPIPAALFMFAPALLGFMGFRRKAKNTLA